MIIGVMCAYQEAGRIGPALASLRAAGCERLVVVDGAWRWFEWYGQTASSTDGTQEIARAAGAEVIEAPAGGWQNEVTARNGYLVGQPGDWYLILDADERATGELPPALDAPEGAYQLWVDTAADGSLWRRMRLVQEDGTACYQNAHWAIYRQGQLVEQAALLDDVRIEHVGRPGDTERDIRKTAWYARAGAHERAYLIDGRPPMRQAEERDMERVAYRYVGGGAWIPGVPARDLLEFEATMYAEALAANLAGARPLWEVATVVADGGDLPSSSSSQGEEGRSARGARTRRAAATAADDETEENEA